jgi:methyl-accepting chemotaxis protein
MSNDQGFGEAASGGAGPSLGLPNLGALLAMLGLPNPVAPVVHTMEQMRRGFDDLLTMIETLQKTLEQLNTTAERVNRMLDDVEVPMRTMGDMMRRMGPLTQVAETATGLLNFKSFLPGSSNSAEPAAKKAPAKKAPAKKA